VSQVFQPRSSRCCSCEYSGERDCGNAIATIISAETVEINRGQTRILEKPHLRAMIPRCRVLLGSSFLAFDRPWLPDRHDSPSRPERKTMDCSLSRAKCEDHSEKSRLLNLYCNQF
jgi:hypothetical protein